MFQLMSIVIGFLIPTLMLLDAFGKINMTAKWSFLILSFLLPHTALCIYSFIQIEKSFPLPIGLYSFLIFDIILFTLYIWMKIHLLPYREKKYGISQRVRILMGGRRLLFYFILSFSFQLLGYAVAWSLHSFAVVPLPIIILDSILTFLLVASLAFNGFLRIVLTSRRISMIKRFILFSLIYIPILNIFVMLYLCRKASIEYDHEVNLVLLNQQRVDSTICKTKYPFILLHGVGFRDLKYINYWGRIPRELIRHGATVYYGNQEAWGTIESNAADIKEKILAILTQTNCEKINIIAHSKGGLDARYMVSQLDMADKVASLTMIGAPHRGSEVIDFLYHLPEGFLNWVGKLIDRYFKLLGDKNPDFCTASQQFLTSRADAFNAQVPDAEGVYYQSYASVMKHPFSDYILSIPYLLMKLRAGDNDGLVAVASARWGEFRGVLTNRHGRGISHGDLIDLRKDDYKGFDVREHYVTMISELREKGF